MVNSAFARSKQRGIGALALLATATTAIAATNWDHWSIPQSIEALSGSSTLINTTFIDGCAAQSRDGLTLFFNSNRAGNHDLYMATRTSKGEGFGDPVRLPAPVNGTTSDEACPTIRSGGQLYFSSNREDPAYDLYVTRHGPKGWTTPQRLGPNINSAQLDESAAFYEDDSGNEVMLFCRRNLNGTGGKIYQSVNGGPASVVAGGPNSSASDCRPSVTKDGKTMFFDSTREGGLGGPDLYYSTRSNTHEPWGTAVHLQALSSSGFDARPFISWDGSMLTYSSNRTGSKSPAPDIWFVTR